MKTYPIIIEYQWAGFLNVNTKNGKIFYPCTLNK